MNNPSQVSLHKAMSYRKPAPVYIPSPPTSPIEHQAPPMITVCPPTASRDSSMPPLPDDWKQVIMGASGFPGERKGSTSTGSSSTLKECDDATIASLRGGMHAPTAESSASFHSTKSSRKQSQQSYRPPTPPLPSSNRRPREDTVDGELDLGPDARPDISNRQFAVYGYEAGTPVIYSALAGRTSFMTERSTRPVSLSNTSSIAISNESHLVPELPCVNGIPVPPMHIVALSTKSDTSPSPNQLDHSWWDCISSFGKSMARGFRWIFCCGAPSAVNGTV